MEASNIVGDQDGIDLWNLMAQSNDPLEKAYFVRLNDSAVKYGLIWFSDMISQNLKKLNNQAVWKLEWNKTSLQWEISLFHLPEGATKRSSRLNQQDDEWIELSVDDIVTEE